MRFVVFAGCFSVIELNTASLELSPAVFSILSALIDEHAGLHYELLDRELLREKASSRALDAGFHSLLDYYYFLRYDAGGEKELSALIETLVVNETYLFREWPAIEVIVDHFIAPWCAQGRRPRIWSAACATGEEPISLAMLLKKKNLLDRVEIVATDISQRVLDKAQKGQFGRRAVRHVPDSELLETFVVPEAHGYSVSPELVNSINWSKHNLLSKTGRDTLGSFDIILCRNVLIYFSDKTILDVLENLHDQLTASGILVVGVSESLLRYGSCFTGEDRGGAFIYRKSNALAKSL